jgi:hypothetical protein
MNTAKVRISESTWQDLELILFSNYPRNENACFLECGWAYGNSSLIITVKSLFSPKPNDVESSASLVGLNEAYSIRCALAVEKTKFTIGLVHSHPEGCGTLPSAIDNDMDEYFANYFQGFIPDRPYLSFIVSKNEDGQLKFSGRAIVGGKVYQCQHLQIVGQKNQVIFSDGIDPRDLPPLIEQRLERLTGALGKVSAKKLWNTKVGIIGAGGTGSAIFHSLVRSCVGQIVIVDPDKISISNSERVHGLKHTDIDGNFKHKVDILKRFASEINPDIEVTALKLKANSEVALQHLMECDLILGCTDSQIGKLITSDIALRFLLPAFHLNVAMETTRSELSGEIIHLTQLGPDLPCPQCRNQIDAHLLAQELMSEAEQLQRQKAASETTVDRKQMYWKNEPVILTVGSLTTIASELAAIYAIGLITGAYKVPAQFLEMNLLQPLLGLITVPLRRRPGCLCKNHDGVSTQGEGWLMLPKTIQSDSN